MKENALTQNKNSSENGSSAVVPSSHHQSAVAQRSCWWWPSNSIMSLNDDTDGAAPTVSTCNYSTTQNASSHFQTTTPTTIEVPNTAKVSNDSIPNTYDRFIMATNFLIPQDIATQIWNYMSMIHPGHYCILTSIPLLLNTYYGYHKFYRLFQEPIVATTIDMTTAVAISVEESYRRRTMAVTVASRALRVATNGMIGLFVGGIGIILYTIIPRHQSHYSTAEIVPSMQQATRKYYRAWDESIRALFTNRHQNIDPSQSISRHRYYDETHPEYQKIQKMTEAEELEYIYQTYIQEEESQQSSNNAKSEDNT